jgi:cytochrome c oxidase subunit 3
MSHEFNDDVGKKMGMWIFIFTELFLFGGLFLVYAVFRANYTEGFHSAAADLDAFVGTLNTVILLASSATVAMSITAVQKGNNKLALKFLIATILFAIAFMINKYFEWGHKFELKLYPGSEIMEQLDKGEILFFGLYYMMTGLHALHVVIGVVLLAVSYVKVKKGTINSQKFIFLENSGLYWHLVDFIWIFLFPLMYLVT